MRKSALVITALLATFQFGCSEIPIPGEGKHPPKYARPDTERFGDWFLQIGHCELTGNSPEVHTTTDGSLDGNSIELRLHFAVPLAQHPRIAFNSLPVALRLEGANQDYTVTLPYSPATVAHYMQGDSFITISYMPANSDTDLEVNFGTSGMVSGITYLGRVCH